MKLDHIQSTDDLLAFLDERGIQPVTYDADKFAIDDVHFMRIHIVDELNTSIMERFKRNIGDELYVNYQLIASDNLDKIAIQRGYGIPYRVLYDKNKKYAKDTKRSLIKKFNALKFNDGDFNPTFDNLFSVSEVVDKFYSEYTDVRDKLADIIGEDDVVHSHVLLDRLIFIYFLQARGILDDKFLTKLYINMKEGEDYYRDYLYPLFFELFNKEPSIRDPYIENKFPGIPYLNGGLFSPHGMELDGLDIPNDVWKEIFDLLDGYEWIVEEDKSDSTAITPSILGHIYEKSIQQKITGSFYTPVEITEYISTNTIIPLITEKVNRKFGTEYDDVERELLSKSEHDEEEISQISYLYFNVLRNVTICDPACGSGAFLIAAEYVLFDLYKKCIQILLFKSEFKEERNRLGNAPEYIMKRDIITRNLYGVDIQEGSVEIAKLRLWLSMISEMNDPNGIEPLPNIDYNIRAGNSLVGYTKMPSRENGIMRFFDRNKTLLDELKEKRNEYRMERSSEKSKEIKEYIDEKIVPLRKELNKMLCNELNLTVTETLSLNGSEDELLDLIQALNDKAVITKFKINCNSPNELNPDVIRNVDGMTCYTSRKSGEVSSIYPTSSFNWVRYNRSGSLVRLIRSMISDWTAVQDVEIEKKMAVNDLETLKPFHWVIEFYEVFNK